VSDGTRRAIGLSRSMSGRVISSNSRALAPSLSIASSRLAGVTEFGQFLLNARRAKIDPYTQASYTQDALGEAVGVSGKAISAYENGENTPSIETVNLLCRVLGVSVTAACRALGYAVESKLNEEEERVVALLQRMPEGARAMLIPMIEAGASGYPRLEAERTARRRARER